MEGILMHGSIDQYSMSPYKKNPNNKINHHHFLPQATLGLLQAPPPPPYLSHSYPPYSLHRQPPLLPLPAATPHGSIPRFPPAKPNNGNRRSRDSSLTPKKSKSHKKEVRNFNSVTEELPRNHVDKVFPFISSSGNLYTTNKSNIIRPRKEVEDYNIDGVFSGSAVFTISPPPSSLPLPTFSLRPKLSCRAEAAAGIDAGATDDLRRLLRLH